MQALRAFPLLSIVVVLYNLVAVVGGADLTRPFVSATMPTGSPFMLTRGEALLALGLVLLYGEILKATRTSQASILDHGLSMVVFVVCLIQFLVVKSAATGVFFLIMGMTLLDVIAGFSVTIVAARRDYSPSDR